MQDSEGNITMFPTQSHAPISDCDQVIASHEGVDASHIHQTANCEASENGDDELAMLNPLSVSPAREESDSSTLGLQVTSQSQLYDNSSGRDITDSIQSCESVDSEEEEQLGGNLAERRQTKRSRQFPRAHSAEKRPRRTPDTDYTQNNSIAMNDQLRGESPMQNESLEAASPANISSHYLRSYDTLTSKYGDDTDFNLKPAQIMSIIKAGDSFFRGDSVNFVTSYLESSYDGRWNTPIPCPPLNGALTEVLFKSFCCAEILDQRAIVDPIRLRVARILLFWYYERLHRSPELLKRCSHGKTTASVATDILLQEIFKCNPQDWSRRRMQFQRHKQIGKRWSMIIGCIGPGFLLICSPDLATYMYFIH
jgi:hypothetical protein